MRTRKVVSTAVLAGLLVGAWMFGVQISAAEQRHPGHDKFHGDAAHALLGMEVALQRIATFRVEGEMPPDKDAIHEKVAHGFKEALELFGVPVSMAKQVDRNKFHGDVAHALLGMEVALQRIATFRVEGEMPPDKDAIHEKVAHGFKEALELFGVKTKT